MVTGIEQLDAMIARCRTLGDGPEYVQAVGKAVEQSLTADLTAGLDPNTGAAWQPTKDGQKPLRNAAAQLHIRLSGNSVIASISGRYALHHFGVRGAKGRRQVPQGNMPAKLSDAIRSGMVKIFRKKAVGR